MIASVVVAVLAISIWNHYRAETIAKNPNRIPEFFGLKTFKYRLQDEMYSQDSEGCVGFGCISYWLTEIDTVNSNVREDMLERGALESDGSLKLVTETGDVTGQMTLYCDSTSVKATVNYRKI